MIIVEKGDWKEYRKLPNSIEQDFHFSDGERYVPYYEAMSTIYEIALNSLKDAYDKGIQYVIFTHGHSTSRNGKQTARSVIRGLMKSKEATPYIIRKKSIQHYSVFVAAIRSKE